MLPCSYKSLSKMNNYDTFIADLTNTNGSAALEAAWDKLFTEAAWWSELLATRDELELKKIVQAAENWTGAKWNTARASKQLYKLTNVGLV